MTGADALHRLADVSSLQVRESDLADALALALVAVRPVSDAETRERLDAALRGRVAIEQAKGVLAHEEGLTMEQAFARLLALADERGEPLGETCQYVVERAHEKRSP